MLLDGIKTHVTHKINLALEKSFLLEEAVAALKQIHLSKVSTKWCACTFLFKNFDILQEIMS